MAFKTSLLLVLSIVYANVVAAPVALPEAGTDDTLDTLSTASAAYVHGSYGYDKRAEDKTDDTLDTLSTASAAYVHGSYGYDKRNE
ncbi:hypothetical protein N0V82_007392 [Gnomoniopsis sp. IMI 355080]|nr:hypothetical protein N0V82_007392 [Gnomoniopsis sp. IMI 355080]